MTAMSPQKALDTLYDILALLHRLEPGFHTREDCADLGEAHWALSDVAKRLEAQIARNQAEEKEPQL
jgi:hypothetical protein